MNERDRQSNRDVKKRANSRNAESGFESRTFFAAFARATNQADNCTARAQVSEKARLYIAPKSRWHHHRQWRIMVVNNQEKHETKQ
jgi:hypothetical protein